jgi:hypothetical protein
MSAVGDEFRLARLYRYRDRGEVPPPWVANPTKRELEIVALARESEHPLRTAVELGILPVKRAARLVRGDA